MIKNERVKRLRSSRRERGLCPQCGRKPIDGFKLCHWCRERERARYVGKMEESAEKWKRVARFLNSNGGVK